MAASLVGPLALFGAGCPWNAFDDLKDQAPVQVIEKPKKFSSPLFGRHFLVLEDPGYERSLVVGGHFTDPLAVIRLKVNGQIHSTRVARLTMDDIVTADDRQRNLVEAMVRIGDSATGEPRVLLGVSQLDYLRRVTIPKEGSLLPETTRLYLVRPGGGTLSGLGGALAAGSFNGAATLDWAVAEDDFTFFVMDEDTTATGDASAVIACPVPNPGGAHPSTDRAIAAGRFFEADAPGIQAAAVGIPRTGSGEVRIYRFPGGYVDCNNADLLQAPVGAPGDAPFFGTALLVADLNEDGLDDLVVGSPDGANSRVYVFMSGGTAGSRSLEDTPTYTLQPEDGGAVEFGAALGLADLDGDGTPELLVGDPGAPFGTNTGRVHIFKAAWSQGDPVGEEAVVGDPSAKASMTGIDLKDPTTGFGRSMAAMGWGNPGWAGEELIVGAFEHIFAFFLTTLTGDHPTGDASNLADPRF